ncbi:CGMP-dependent kinase 5-1 (macronuclear) [Tetrahymena thermophila SB210]|uniref:cGMP-dependent protein kinase n=1 Tax=Tetrahymena thermophila (strain SB210) TaxID=312017 RepID=I7MFS4_TETTS|nr:CGMP-dependent kinase 5-1 [Tetrahymena thermophila SB210]EAR84179.1 CGMP-dependent kinase 5-1 [Tetrahymena thermophila SB210]|eukprot:XP_001031842.1 CGMP-dependent kinase 5-1 [Tetrahymena thermophila SB210]
MGCGTNSKIAPNIPQKKSQFSNENGANKGKQTSTSIDTDLKNTDANQTLGSKNNNSKKVSPAGTDADQKGLTLQINQSQKVPGSNSASIQLMKQGSQVNTNITQQQQISPPKLAKENSISIRRTVTNSKPRPSMDVQELLGKTIPNQLQDGAQGGYLPAMNSNSKNEMPSPSPAQISSKTFKDGFEQQKQGSENQLNIERKNRKEGQQNNKLFLQSGNQDEKTENYTRQSKKPNQEENDFIIQSLKNNSVFYSLSEDQIKEVANQMFLCQTKKDQYLFKQGDKASAFFFIKSGTIAIEIDEQEKKQLGPGTGIGELALLYSAPRSASIKCIVDCQFWAIDRHTFRKTVEEIVQRDSQTNRKFMESVPFFSFMSDEQKDSIASALISVRFKPGDNIVSEGDRADSFYLIKEGKVSVWKNGVLIRNLYQSDSFGEQALYIKSTRAATVKADEEVKLLSLGRDDLTRILGGKIQKIVYANKQRWAYNNNQLLLKLTNIQVEKILMNTKISNYKNGTVLYEKGDYCDTLIAVLDGNIKGEDSGQILADKGQIFGDYYLPLTNQNIQFDQRIVIGSDAVLSTISFKQFHKCIGGDVLSVIKKNVDSHEVKMKRENQKEDYSHIKLEDLIYIKKLGVGQFGSVYLVRRKNTRELYALKSVSKGQIIEQNLEKHLISEKNVLEMIQFPFIMNFIRTFKDDQSVYFLLKFINGLELFDVIRDIGLLSTFDSQFYVGSLILCLEYLHSRQIIYRDVKPENMMVDHTGYMYMIDMGAAKLLSKGKSIGRTFTIIGTPHYMAPEIIKGKGYSYSSDLWSVGICLYEFMCGQVPYAEDAQDPYEIYEEINSKDIKFPPFLKDRKAKLLIEQLLQKVPELRLGGSYAALKTNPWFDNFEWDQLYNKQISPPYIPPQEKLLNSDMLEKKYREGKLVIQKIKQEQDKDSTKYNIGMARDPNWDNAF